MIFSSIYRSFDASQGFSDNVSTNTQSQLYTYYLYKYLPNSIMLINGYGTIYCYTIWYMANTDKPKLWYASLKKIAMQ